MINYYQVLLTYQKPSDSQLEKSTAAHCHNEVHKITDLFKKARIHARLASIYFGGTAAYYVRSERNLFSLRGTLERILSGTGIVVGNVITVKSPDTTPSKPGYATIRDYLNDKSKPNA